MTLFRISNDAYVRATISEKVQISFVLGDDLLSTKNVNPCMLVPPANSCKTCKTPILNNHTVSRKLKLNKNKARHKYLSEYNQVPSTTKVCIIRLVYIYFEIFSSTF